MGVWMGHKAKGARRRDVTSVRPLLLSIDYQRVSQPHL